MSGVRLPAGEYFSMVGLIRADAGGQTRAMLMRNRIFARNAGITPKLLTFDPSLVYPQVRHGLTEQGLLVPPMVIENIYEWYRENSIDHLPPTTAQLPPLDIYETKSDLHPDGTVFRTRYLDRWTHKDRAADYHRSDGSVFIRLPSGDEADAHPVTPVLLCDTRQRVLSRWPNKDMWHRHWLRQLTPKGVRAFVISDSRFALSHIVPMRDRRFHLIHLMHSAHTTGARLWSSPLAGDYAPLLAAVPLLDGLVNLTRRQSDEIRQRRGDTNNLFVVPNPVEVPDPPVDLPTRDQKRVVLVTRLERVKRIDQAIKAFALVVEAEPEATMEIYGSGNLHIRLEKQIEELGLTGSVKLMGYDRRAADALWTATAMLMTSRLEGYPLSVLESMARGCPVISYDFKYGPREQITDGVDGYVVGDDDAAAMADRVVRIMRDPALLASMSSAAIAKGRLHDETAFLDDWRHVLETVVDNRPARTRINSVDLKVHRLGSERPGLPTKLRRRTTNASRSVTASTDIQLAATLTVHGTSGPAASLDSAQVTLAAVCDTTGDVHEMPLTTVRTGNDLEVSASFHPGDVFANVSPEVDSVRLRLRLVWNNSSWESYLSRDASARPRFELAFGEDDALHLHQRATGRPGRPSLRATSPTDVEPTIEAGAAPGAPAQSEPPAG